MSQGEQVSTQRSGAIDLLRAGLLVYVVAYLHLGGYIGDGQQHVHWSTVAVTNVVLGTFTFLSGYVLGEWKGGMNMQALLGFYGRRLVRVYPLYLLALAGFVLVWLVDVHTAVRGAVVISMFYPPPPMTLWFITMIIVCYVFAPALIVPSPRAGLVVGVLLWVAMLGFHFGVNETDPRMLTQFPAFAAGVACRRLGLREPGRLPIGWLVAGFAAALVAAIFTLDRPLLGAIVAVPSVIVGPLLLLAVANRYFADVGRHRVVVLLSYLSFSAYLFHRIVFEVVKRAAWPSSQAGQVAVLVLIGLPAVLLVALLVQSGYDRLLALFGSQRRLRATST
ncbi:hypothetical protein BH11PSE9_BH11PSE9_01540 [soil metagenome]